jgi:hypothetical protein
MRDHQPGSRRRNVLADETAAPAGHQQRSRVQRRHLPSHPSNDKPATARLNHMLNDIPYGARATCGSPSSSHYP